MIENEIDVWNSGAPVVSSGGDHEFNVWENGAPIVEQDEGGDGSFRRPAMIF